MHAQIAFAEAAHSLLCFYLSGQEAVVGHDVSFNVVIGDLLVKALVENTLAAQIAVNVLGCDICLKYRVNDIFSPAVRVATNEYAGHGGSLRVAVCNHLAAAQSQLVLEEIGIRDL